MEEIILYTKAGCHLCEDAKSLLDGLQSAYPHQLLEIDIRSNSEIHERYLFEIPVIEQNGMVCKAPITAEKLTIFLKQSKKTSQSDH